MGLEAWFVWLLGTNNKNCQGFETKTEKGELRVVGQAEGARVIIPGPQP